MLSTSVNEFLIMSYDYSGFSYHRELSFSSISMESVEML